MIDKCYEILDFSLPFAMTFADFERSVESPEGEVRPCILSCTVLLFRK